jgi:hypothetical protein
VRPPRDDPSPPLRDGRPRPRAAVVGLDDGGVAVGEEDVAVDGLDGVPEEEEPEDVLSAASVLLRLTVTRLLEDLDEEP